MSIRLRHREGKFLDRFNEWNKIKKETHAKDFTLGVKPREIFGSKIGQNVGYEQNGKGKNFARPVIIVRRLTKDLFVGIPTTTTIRDDSDYFHSFNYLDRNKKELKVSALILQIKVFSIKRVMNKIGTMDKESFGKITKKAKGLIGPT